MIGDYNPSMFAMKNRDTAFRSGQVFLRVLVHANKTGSHEFVGIVRCSFFNLTDLVEPYYSDLTVSATHATLLEEFTSLCDILLSQPPPSR